MRQIDRDEYLFVHRFAPVASLASVNGLLTLLTGIVTVLTNFRLLLVHKSQFACVKARLAFAFALTGMWP